MSRLNWRARLSSLQFLIAFGVILFPLQISAQKATGWRFERMPEDERLTAGQITNLQICPTEPYWIAYERLVKDYQEVYIYSSLQKNLQQVTAVEEESADNLPEDDLFLALQTKNKLRSFEGDLDWMPFVNDEGRRWFAFVSTGNDKTTDIYLSFVDENGMVEQKPIRLRRDGLERYPRWSPDGEKLIFVSEGEQNSDLFLCTNIQDVIGDPENESPEVIRLTDNPGQDNFPSWAPPADEETRYSHHIAFESVRKIGDYSVYGIYLLDLEELSDDRLPKPLWITADLKDYHCFKPSWSPDGEMIACYINQAEIGSNSENKFRDIAICQLTKPRGRITGAVALRGSNRRIAMDVIMNESRGPSWGVYNSNAFICYVQNKPQQDYPMWMAYVNQWVERKDASEYLKQLELGTKLNKELVFHPVSIGYNFSFVSQQDTVMQLRRIYAASNKSSQGWPIPVEKSRSRSMMRAAVPGWAQRYKGEPAKSMLLAGSAALALGGAVIYHNKMMDAIEPCNEARMEYLNLPSTGSKAEFEEVFKEWDGKYNQVQSSNNMKKIFLSLALGVWLYNLYDSYRGFPLIRSEAMPVQPGIEKELFLTWSPELQIKSIHGHSALCLGGTIHF